MKNAASPARACRRRRLSGVAALLCYPIPGFALPSSARATVSCTAPGTGWCVARRFAGSVPKGELGFLIRAWDGEASDGLFGHWVMPVPDISGDGLADLVIAAPHALVDGRMRGVLVARSPKTGAELWKRAETESGNLGWDLTLAGDQDGDGHTDLFVGAPSGDNGRVYLLSGKDGSVLQTYLPREAAGDFGWYVARL
ncbi:MAG: hypothetical protein E6J68_12380, partial [Deltaproteobacteria bacterium]